MCDGMVTRQTSALPSSAFSSWSLAHSLATSALLLFTLLPHVDASGKAWKRTSRHVIPPWHWSLVMHQNRNRRYVVCGSQCCYQVFISCAIYCPFRAFSVASKFDLSWPPIEKGWICEERQQTESRMMLREVVGCVLWINLTLSYVTLDSCRAKKGW